MWLTLTLTGLLTASAAGTGWWHFHLKLKSVHRIDRLDVASVDPHRLADGLYQDRFTTPFEEYLIRVRVAGGRIKDGDIRPGNTEYGHYDRLAVSVKSWIMFNQR